MARLVHCGYHIYNYIFPSKKLQAQKSCESRDKKGIDAGNMLSQSLKKYNDVLYGQPGNLGVSHVT